MIKVSVIMPVYNSEKCLSGSINSFLSQTLKDIELICVDDGSTDESLSILEEYSKKDNRIVVLHQENSGAGKARNLAIENSKGEYVAFLDSDDSFYDENTLNMLYEMAKKNDAMVAGGSLAILDNGEIKKGVVGGTDYTFYKESVIYYRNLQQAFYYQRFIFSKEMLLTNDVWFPDYKRFQDAVFFVEAMSKTNKIAITSKITYLYRKEDKFSYFSDEKVNDILKGHIDILNISKENNYQDLFLWCLRRLTDNETMKNIIQNSYSSGNKEIRNLMSTVKSIVETSGIPLGNIKTSYLDVYLVDCIAEKKKEVLKLCKKEHIKRELNKSVGNPLVTIVVPVYNVENYVDTTIESIVEQDYQNVEIICVNDGSTDNSREIVKEWTKKDNRVKLIDQDNQGLSAARNTGIKAAQGKYIQFVDSDDAVTKESIAFFANYAEINDLDYISFDALTFYEDYELSFKLPNYLHFYDRRNARDSITSGINILASQVETDSYKTSACLSFIRTSFIKDNNIYFENGILHEDNLFTFDAMIKSKRCVYLDEIGYLRRIRKNSIMTETIRFANVYGLFVCYIKMKKIADEIEMDEYQHCYIEQLLRSLLRGIRNRYKSLDEEEKNKENIYIKDLAYDFDILVKEPVDTSAKLTKITTDKKNFEKNYQYESRVRKENDIKIEKLKKKVRYYKKRMGIIPKIKEKIKAKLK